MKSMNYYNKKVKNDKLRQLIIMCTYNIKGLTKKEEIEELLPIKVKDVLIRIKDNTVVFERGNEEIGDVWIDTNCYSNLDILKNITPLFGIEFTGDEILELIKYRNKIILTLL